MSLLHHWTISTSLSVLPGVPAVNQLWQKVFPAIAYKHAYMMHGLISLTALHIAYLNPDDRSANLHIAAHHHTLALSGFRADIDTIGPHNAEAIFATSTLMFFYAFCTFSKLSDADVDKQRGGDTTHNSLAARTSRILGAEWIPLIRGIQTVIHPIYEYLREGPLRSALQLKDWDIIDPDTKPGPDDEHVLRIKHTWAEDENKAVYDETLYLLRKMSAWCVHFRNTWDDHQEEWGYNGSWSAVSDLKVPAQLLEPFTDVNLFLAISAAVYLVVSRIKRLLQATAAAATLGFAHLCLFRSTTRAAPHRLVDRQLRQKYRGCSR
jgi:hypothetical protein